MEFICIVNQHHAAVSVVARIEKNLDCDLMAKRLSAVSAKRKKGGRSVQKMSLLRSKSRSL